MKKGDADFLLTPKEPSESLNFSRVHPSTHLSMQPVIHQSIHPSRYTYKWTSADEFALVTCAADLGAVLHYTRKKTKMIQLFGNPCEFTVRHIEPFDSQKKRMTVAVETSDGQILVFSKGADVSILKCLEESHLATEKAKDGLRHATLLAASGHRVLSVAYKLMRPEDYESWHSCYESTLTDEARHENRLEQGMTYLGSYGLWDPVDNTVRPAIRQLGPGIMFWVATGDQLPTAFMVSVHVRLGACECHASVLG